MNKADKIVKWIEKFNNEFGFSYGKKINDFEVAIEMEKWEEDREIFVHFLVFECMDEGKLPVRVKVNEEMLNTATINGNMLILNGHNTYDGKPFDMEIVFSKITETPCEINLHEELS